MNETTESVEYALSADYRGGLWDRVVKAADAYNKTTDKLNVIAQRWVSGEILAGTARQDVLHAIRANSTTASALKDSTLLSGWTSAVSRAARAFDALTAERPDLADIHVRLAVTGADAYTWRGVFRGKATSGKRAAGDTFAPMTITAAMDNAVSVGANELNTLVRRDAEFIGALSAMGVPVLRFMQLWHETGNVKATDAAESAPAESAPAESAPRDLWAAVVDAIEALTDAAPRMTDDELNRATRAMSNAARAWRGAAATRHAELSATAKVDA